MIEKSNAIVLNHQPFSETSRIVTWLTEHHGKTYTMIKGALRPKSWFLGQYDLFYTCELIFYTKPGRHLHTASECYPIKTRARFRQDWKTCAMASYCCDLLARICLPDAPHDFLFSFLDETLDELERNGQSRTYLFWVELKLLEHLGLQPHLQSCQKCTKTLNARDRNTHFSFARGGTLCPTCSSTERDLQPIAPDILATLQGWQRAQTPHIARATRCTPRQLQKIENFMGIFLRHHLEQPLESRKIALKTMQHELDSNFHSY